jgi:hypothetical protein
MVDINLDLLIQGQLDLRVAGSIGLLNEGGEKRSGIEQWKRTRIQHTPRSLPGPSSRGQEAAGQIVWDETEGDARPSPVESQSQPGRTLKRAARETREAMSELRKSMKSEDDAQRIRHARERLREAVIRLSKEVRRRTVTASEEGVPAG